MTTTLLVVIPIICGFLLSEYRKKITTLSVIIILTLIASIAIYEKIESQNDQIANKNQLVENLNATLDSKNEIIDKFTGTNDNLSIVARPFLDGKEIFYQFRIENNSYTPIYDVTVSHFPPHEIEKLNHNGLSTVQSKKLYIRERIGSLGGQEWVDLGNPFQVNNQEEIYYRFFINTRHGMYWRTFVALNEGEIFLKSAYKTWRNQITGIDTITDPLMLSRFNKTNQDTFILDVRDFVVIDSFVPKDFNVDFIKKYYAWSNKYDTSYVDRYLIKDTLLSN